MSVFQGPAAHQWYSAAWKLRVELAGAEDTPVWREVLVPESMPLRILRYVIDQLFSLSPTPEYQFSIPEEEFIRQTDDRFTEYCRLCGARFRFPTIRDEESCCGEEEVDPKEWLRRRYRGSYTYHGNADHLVENQQAVRNFLMVFTGLRESPVIDLNEYRRGEVKVEKTKRAPAASLTMREVLEAELFKTNPNQVLERLRIPEVLFLDRKKAPAPNLPEPEEFYPELLWGGYFDRCFARLERIHQRSMEAVRIHHELMDRHVRLDEDMDEETELLVSRWADAQQEARQSYDRLVRETMPEPEPFTSELRYCRPKEGITIRITPVDRYVLTDEEMVEGARETLPEAATAHSVRLCVVKRAPVCCGGSGTLEDPDARLHWNELL